METEHKETSWSDVLPVVATSREKNRRSWLKQLVRHG